MSVRNLFEFEERPQGRASDGDYDPFVFGDAAEEREPAPMAEATDPNLVNYPRAEKLLGKVKLRKADHNLRTREYFETQGYICFRVDQRVATNSGMIYTLDWLGLFDWLAIKKGEMDVGIQVCRYEDMGTHETAMCSSKITTFNDRPKGDNLRDWLLTGHRAVILGWRQPGGKGTKWVPHLRELTPERVEASIARRRGK